MGRLEKRCWLNRNLHGLVTTRFAKMVISPSRFPYGFSIECAGTGVFFLLEDCPITAPSFLCQLKTGITTHRYKWGGVYPVPPQSGPNPAGELHRKK